MINWRYNFTEYMSVFLMIAQMYSAPALADEEPLRMIVDIASETMFVYEALPVAVTFYNTSENAFPIHRDAFRMPRGVGVVTILDPDGNTHELHQPRFGSLAPDEVYWPLSPGQERRIAFLLAYDDSSGKEAIFATPGEYTIAVKYVDRVADSPIAVRRQFTDVALTSEEFVINVLEAPESERLALQLVKVLHPQIMLYEPSAIRAGVTPPYFEQSRQALREIASVEGSSVYANYARRSLAEHHIDIARAALKYPEFYDVNKNIAAARAMLDAIDTKEFALADRVEKLRGELTEILQALEDGDDSRTPAPLDLING